MLSFIQLHGLLCKYQKVYFISYNVCFFFYIFIEHDVFAISLDATHIVNRRHAKRVFHIFRSICEPEKVLQNLLYELFISLTDKETLPPRNTLVPNLRSTISKSPNQKSVHISLVPQIVTYDPLTPPSFLHAYVKFPYPETHHNVFHNFHFMRKAFKIPFDPRHPPK